MTTQTSTVGTGYGWVCPACRDSSGPMFASQAEAGHLAAVHDLLWHGAPSAVVTFVLELGGTR